jgi:alpha-tubulin suppressor-like RCC1 family protein
VKLPTPCEALSALRPVQLLGGEQTLMAVTADGKVYATGKCDMKGVRCAVLYCVATAGSFRLSLMLHI